VSHTCIPHGLRFTVCCCCCLALMVYVAGHGVGRRVTIRTTDRSCYTTCIVMPRWHDPGSKQHRSQPCIRQILLLPEFLSIQHPKNSIRWQKNFLLREVHQANDCLMQIQLQTFVMHCCEREMKGGHAINIPRDLRNGGNTGGRARARGVSAVRAPIAIPFSHSLYNLHLEKYLISPYND
jgi:hypothetical protein